eukprot:g6604.t1
MEETFRALDLDSSCKVSADEFRVAIKHGCHGIDSSWEERLWEIYSQDFTSRTATGTGRGTGDNGAHHASPDEVAEMDFTSYLRTSARILTGATERARSSSTAAVVAPAQAQAQAQTLRAGVSDRASDRAATTDRHMLVHVVCRVCTAALEARNRTRELGMAYRFNAVLDPWRVASMALSNMLAPVGWLYYHLVEPGLERLHWPHLDLRRTLWVGAEHGTVGAMLLYYAGFFVAAALLGALVAEERYYVSWKEYENTTSATAAGLVSSAEGYSACGIYLVLAFLSTIKNGVPEDMSSSASVWVSGLLRDTEEGACLEKVDRILAVLDPFTYKAAGGETAAAGAAAGGSSSAAARTVATTTTTTPPGPREKNGQGGGGTGSGSAGGDAPAGGSTPVSPAAWSFSLVAFFFVGTFFFGAFFFAAFCFGLAPLVDLYCFILAALFLVWATCFLVAFFFSLAPLVEVHCAVGAAIFSLVPTLRRMYKGATLSQALALPTEAAICAVMQQEAQRTAAGAGASGGAARIVAGASGGCGSDDASRHYYHMYSWYNDLDPVRTQTYAATAASIWLVVLLVVHLLLDSRRHKLAAWTRPLLLSYTAVVLAATLGACLGVVGPRRGAALVTRPVAVAANLVLSTLLLRQLLRILVNTYSKFSVTTARLNCFTSLADYPRYLELRHASARGVVAWGRARALLLQKSINAESAVMQINFGVFLAVDFITSVLLVVHAVAVRAGSGGADGDGAGASAGAGGAGGNRFDPLAFLTGTTRMLVVAFVLITAPWLLKIIATRVHQAEIMGSHVALCERAKYEAKM